MDAFTLLVILGSIALSAFFAGIEIAFVSANKLKIELDKKQGKLSGRILSFFNDREDKLITALLIGNNIGLVTFGIFFAAIAEPFIEAHVSHNHIVVLLLQTISSTLVVVIAAEFIPKAIFSVEPNAVLRFMAVPLAVAYFILWLPTMFTIMVSRLVLKLFTKSKAKETEQKFNRVDLDDYVKKATEIAAPDQVIDHEVHLFKNALDFSKVRARDCMIPRTEIVAMEITQTIQELKQKFIETQLSKILIYKENIDDIIGYVHSYEIFKNPKDIKSILRPISFVPASMPGQIVMQEFTKQHRSIAVVVDEFGGTAGIVTIEDLLEEIIGEIDDEHDVAEFTDEKISDTEYIFAGRTEIDFINNKYPINLPRSEEYDTIAGWFLKIYQDIPEKGITIEKDQFVLTVLEAIDNKIEKIKLDIKTS